MPGIEKIMVPLAFSRFSKAILEYAAMLGRPFGAELLLVNVIDQRDVEAVQRISSLGYEVDESHYVELVEKERIGQLEQMLADLDYPDERIRFVFKVGHPADVLLKMAVRERVDMIVMGIKAKSELAHIFTGSVAEKLFRRSPVTIVSYRDEENAAKLRRRIERHMEE